MRKYAIGGVALVLLCGIGIGLWRASAPALGKRLLASTLGLAPERVSHLRVSRNYWTIDPTYWMTFRTPECTLRSAIAKTGALSCDFGRLSALWYHEAPDWWGPRDPGSAEFWTVDDGLTLRIISLDSNGVVYVKVLTY